MNKEKEFIKEFIDKLKNNDSIVFRNDNHDHYNYLVDIDEHTFVITSKNEIKHRKYSSSRYQGFSGYYDDIPLAHSRKIRNLTTKMFRKQAQAELNKQRAEVLALIGKEQ